MSAALPTVSFFCVVLLSTFAAGPRIRTDFSQLVLVFWLIVCNLIQGINSLVWAGNTDIHVPGWCDLVTNILLGLVVAIPGACICIATKLARVHNDQKKASEKRLEYILNGIFCIIVPVIYMLLHLIVQDHRFNISENYGCTAASFPANQTLALLLFPPTLLGLVAFFRCTQAFNQFSRGFHAFDAHASANTMSSFPDFSRRVSTVMILGGISMLVTTFAIFIRSPIVPWPSLEEVHKDFAVIAIVKSELELVYIKFSWWTVPSFSWLYIVLSFVLGEDIRDAVRHSPKAFSGLAEKFRDFEPRLPRKPILPIHRKRVSKIPSMIEVEPVDKLVSGWDDMIKMTTLGRNSPKSPSPSRTRSPNSTIRSGTASPALGSSSQRPALSLRTSNEETLHSSISSTSSARSSLPEDRPMSPEDDAFCASTIQYLGSPTAYSLGLQSPLIHPPSVYRSPTKTREGAPQWKQSSMLSVPQSIPDDVQSTVSSIFDMPWPQPPSPPLFTPAFSETVYGVEHNSSFENVRNYALPFQGPTVHPIPGGSRPVSPLDRSVSPTKAKKYLRRGAIHGPPGETVYMTVVQETA